MNKKPRLWLSVLAFGVAGGIRAPNLIFGRKREQPMEVIDTDVAVVGAGHRHRPRRMDQHTETKKKIGAKQFA
jgi:hypothetical protein